jgi:hypothetical protein
MDAITPAQHLTIALVATGGQMHETIAHMEHASAGGRSAPHAPPIPDVLYTVLHGILEPRLEDEDEEALVTTARL